jgi:uncharacterized protein DUF4942/methyltransferase family protein
MFGTSTEFYPTPTPVIRQMLKPFIKTYEDGFRRDREFFNCKGKTILDPSAGAGGILDYLKDTFKVEQRKMFAIELDADLRYTLQGKGYKVLGTDFLEYDEPCKFDLILMNPPFSDGAYHVVKAWEVLEDGGQLVALLNSQSLKNPRSQTKEYLVHLLATMIGKTFNADKDSVDELLTELADSGVIEWLGSCFSDSERPTDVDVVLVRLNKPEKQVSKLFEGMNLDIDSDVFAEGFSPNTLAHRDAIANLVAQYNAARKILIERHEAQFKLDFYLKDISQPVYETSESKNSESLENKVTLNDQLLILKSRFWNTVFKKTELGRRTTSDFQDRFTKFTKQQSYIAFTEDNIKDVLMMFVENMNQLMKESLVNVFDEATAHHEDNKVSEGWKTNKSWKLNRRIIVPYGVRFDWGSFQTNYYKEKFYDDMDKILCWLKGVKYEDIMSTRQAMSQFINNLKTNGGYQQKFNSSFFAIRIHKKGTVHLDFLDLKLLEDFNKMAAEGKNWIGSEQPLT